MLDANKVLQKNGPWKDVTKRFDLYNLMERQKEENSIPVSREGSTRWINFIMKTKRVYDATINSGVDQINRGVPSDHRIIHVNLQVETLFDKLDKDAEAPEARKLQSKRSDKVW